MSWKIQYDPLLMDYKRVWESASDDHFLGYFATEAALVAAHPTAVAGDFAIVGDTDTMFVWDTATSAWIQTGSSIYEPLLTMTNLVYVDASYVETDADGTVNRPFATIQEALDAIVGSGTILVQDNDYIEDLDIPAGIKIIALGSNVTIDGTVDAVDLYMKDCTITGAVTVQTNAFVERCTFQDTVDTTAVGYWLNCSFEELLTVGGNTILINCISITTDLQAIQHDDGTLTLRSCNITGSLETDPLIVSEGTMLECYDSVIRNDATVNVALDIDNDGEAPDEINKLFNTVFEGNVTCNASYVLVSGVTLYSTITGTHLTYATTDNKVAGDDEDTTPGYLEDKLQNSLVLDSGTKKIHLSGDVPSPGNLKFYGTDGSGVRGWLTFPTPLIPQGMWNANTNTPDITGTTTTGYLWIVSVAGTTNLGGITDWQVNDWAVKVATGWAKVDNTDAIFVSDTAWTGSNWTSTVLAPSLRIVELAFLDHAIRYADRASALADGDSGKFVQYYSSGGTKDYRLSAYTGASFAGIAQTMYIGTTAVAINRASAALALTGITSIDGTAAKATNLVGGNNTTLLGSIPYQSDTDATTLLPPNTTTTKKFLRQTGTGVNGAIPAWDTLATSDMIIPATRTLYVDMNRGDTYTETGSVLQPFKTIQAAINAVSAPSSTNRWEINIAKGTYPENFTVNQSYINLVGEQWTKLTGTVTIVKADGTGLFTKFNRMRFDGASITITGSTYWVVDFVGCDVLAATLTATGTLGDNSALQFYGGTCSSTMTCTNIITVATQGTQLVYGNVININGGYFNLFGACLGSRTINLNLGAVGTVSCATGTLTKADAKIDLNTASTLLIDAVSDGWVTVTNDGTGIVTYITPFTAMLGNLAMSQMPLSGDWAIAGDLSINVVSPVSQTITIYGSAITLKNGPGTSNGMVLGINTEFNGAGADADFTIKKLTSGDAYVYDAGLDTHRFEGSMGIGAAAVAGYKMNVNYSHDGSVDYSASMNVVHAVTPTVDKASNFLYGMSFVVQKAGNFAWGRLYGNITSPYVTGSGTVSIARAFVGQGVSFCDATATGVVTTAQCFYGTSPSQIGGATATIGTMYGLYIEEMKKSFVTTGYGIYQAGTSDINRFEGTLVSVNTTVSTTKDTGALVLDGGLGVEGTINAGVDIKVYRNSAYQPVASIRADAAPAYNADGTKGERCYTGGYMHECIVTGTGGSGRWVRYVVETSY